MKKYLVPVNEPLLKGNEKKYLLECLRSNYISSNGQYVTKFENRFSKLIDKKYAITVSNGTAALQIAFEALNIKKGSEVILPSFTIISCIYPIIRCGAVPVLVDVDPRTWNMNVHEVEKKITKKTKVIIAPHIYGLPIDMDPLIKIAKKYKLKIIEDAAEVLGLKYKNRACGSFGDISTFSFYANKHITTGEGGMIATDDKYLSERCKSLRNLCFNNKRRFLHYELGWNHRLTNLQSAIGLAQLEKITSFVKKKRKIGDYYLKELATLEKFLYLPLKNNDYAKNIYWVFGIVLKKNIKISIKKLMLLLKKKGIETRNFFWPLHQQPILKKMGYFKNKKFKHSEYLSKNGLYLPTGLSLTLNQQKYVIKTLKKIFLKNEF
jgi:perosamine synthetase